MHHNVNVVNYCPIGLKLKIKQGFFQDVAML